MRENVTQFGTTSETLRHITMFRHGIGDWEI